MLNNKGFAVSAVLYTLLVAFLLFLGVTLSMFQSSSNLVSNANKDIINGTTFEAMQVKSILYDNNNNERTCKKSVETKNDNEYYYYESPTIVRIKSRYGTMYWPKDFGEINYISGKFSYKSGGNVKAYKNIEVTIVGCKDGSTSCLSIKDTINNTTAKYIGFSDDTGLKLYDTCN